MSNMSSREQDAYYAGMKDTADAITERFEYEYRKNKCSEFSIDFIRRILHTVSSHSEKQLLNSSFGRELLRESEQVK